MILQKVIWNSCVPPKVCFLHEGFWKVLNMEQLKKRGFQLASRCPLCKDAEKDLAHLLIHGPKVWSYGRGCTLFQDQPGCARVCPKTYCCAGEDFLQKQNEENLDGGSPLPILGHMGRKKRSYFLKMFSSPNQGWKPTLLALFFSWAGLVNRGIIRLLEFAVYFVGFLWAW